MDFMTFLSIFSFGSFFGMVIKHFLDKGREKEAQLFIAKKEAYSKAVGMLSGFGDRTVHYILSTSKDGNVSNVSFVGYLAEVNNVIAPAILLANKELEEMLYQVDDRALTLFDMIQNLLVGTIRTKEGYYIAGKPIESTTKLLSWKSEQKEFEKKIISIIRDELNI